MKTKEQIQIVVPADLRFSNSVRNFVADLLQVINVTENWINRLILVIDELFMNAVKYGSGSATDNVFFTIDFEDQEIIFIIEDMGTGSGKIDPEQLEKIILNSKEDTSLAKTSGRGLSMIVSNWTNGFHVETKYARGIKVIARKNLSDITSHPDEMTQVSIESMPEVSVINFSKKIDVHDADMEKEMIRNIEGIDKSLFVFDLQELSYINSVFIGLLAKLYNIIMKKKGKVVIVNNSDTIKDTLNLVGLTDIIPIVPDMEEAKKVLLSS